MKDQEMVTDIVEKYVLEACEKLSALRDQYQDIENSTAASAAFIFKAMEILD